MREQPAEPGLDGADTDADAGSFWGSDAHADIVANLAARARRDLEALTQAGTDAHRALEAGTYSHDAAIRSYLDAARDEVRVYAGTVDVPLQLVDREL